MERKLIRLELNNSQKKLKELSQYPWDDFLERLKNMVEDIVNIREEYILFKQKVLPKLYFIINSINKENFLESVVEIEEIISNFLFYNFKINSFYLWNFLIKKLKKRFDVNRDLKYFYLFLEKLETFVKKIDLNQIPYIPESNLYSISRNWVLFVDMDWNNIVFEFEYLVWAEYLEEYKKHSYIYSSIYTKWQVEYNLEEKKEYITQFDWKYFEILKNWIFNILDLIKKNKSVIFWELFYEYKLLNELSNIDFLIDLNDFLLEFEVFFRSNNKLNILLKILEEVIENTYKKNFLDIEAELWITFNYKHIQILKTELFLFFEKIKTIN